MKKFLSLVLALVMMLSLFACGNNADTNSNPPAESKTPDTPDVVESEPVDEPDVYTGLDWDAIDAMDYEDASDTIYDWNLSDFADYYAVAKAEMKDMDQRLALMALAEAKLMESAVFQPIYGNGGAYAMSRVVPRTGSTVLWGLDENKWYNMLVANEIIKADDRNALIGLWSEAEDADAYYAAARAFLDEHGYTLTDAYHYTTSYDMNSWDVIATSEQSNSYFIACTYSGLMEYDAKNVLQPAVAASYDVSADGTVYTFHLRDDVYWVDQQGRQLEQVTANDWVTSMMHLTDNNDELGYLMTSTDGCGIKNYDAYIAGECTFDEVGVKAIDDLTLEYTLEADFPFFTTMLGYGCFAPMNYNFYKSQGGTFGAEGDEYTPGNYGTSPSTIAYCGAYLVTNFTENNIWVYSANPTYWNADAVTLKTIDYTYNDGTDALRTYNECKAGTIAACSINSSALELARTEIPDGETENYFDLYHYVTTNDATTYVGWMNLNRASFTNFNDNTAGVSLKLNDTEAQQRTRVAMNNHHFRLAMAYAFDRGAYNAQQVGDELAYNSLKNTYTPGTFLALQNDVTVDINGTSTTFETGTMYGAMVQAQIDADGYPIKVWDATADGGAGNGDGFDGWYNAANAKAELELAIAELAQVGVEITAENPIHVETMNNPNSQIRTNMANAYKQSIETALEGKVIIDIIEFPDNVTMGYAYYYTGSGADSNYDFSPFSGWGPDYGDAQSYLDTLQAYSFMCKNIGLY